jgi:hypothetical protein
LVFCFLGAGGCNSLACVGLLRAGSNGVHSIGRAQVVLEAEGMKRDFVWVVVALVLVGLLVFTGAIILNSDFSGPKEKLECHVICANISQEDECFKDCLVNKDFARDRLNG